MYLKKYNINMYNLLSRRCLLTKSKKLILLNINMIKRNI